MKDIDDNYLRINGAATHLNVNYFVKEYMTMKNLSLEEAEKVSGGGLIGRLAEFVGLVTAIEGIVNGYLSARK